MSSTNITEPVRRNVSNSEDKDLSLDNSSNKENGQNNRNSALSDSVANGQIGHYKWTNIIYKGLLVLLGLMTSVVIVVLGLDIFLQTSLGDPGPQSLRDLDLFRPGPRSIVVAGSYILLAALMLFIVINRIISTRSLLNDIPKLFIPVGKEHMPYPVFKMVQKSLARVLSLDLDPIDKDLKEVTKGWSITKSAATTQDRSGNSALVISMDSGATEYSKDSANSSNLKKLWNFDFFRNIMKKHHGNTGNTHSGTPAYVFPPNIDVNRETAMPVSKPIPSPASAKSQKINDPIHYRKAIINSSWLFETAMLDMYHRQVKRHAFSHRKSPSISEHKSGIINAENTQNSGSNPQSLRQASADFTGKYKSSPRGVNQLDSEDSIDIKPAMKQSWSFKRSHDSLNSSYKLKHLSHSFNASSSQNEYLSGSDHEFIQIPTSSHGDQLHRRHSICYRRLPTSQTFLDFVHDICEAHGLDKTIWMYYSSIYDKASQTIGWDSDKWRNWREKRRRLRKDLWKTRSNIGMLPQSCNHPISSAETVSGYSYKNPNNIEITKEEYEDAMKCLVLMIKQISASDPI